MSKKKKMNMRSLKPFTGTPGIPGWVIDMANDMEKGVIEVCTGQWLVKRDGTRYEFYLLVATDR